MKSYRLRRRGSRAGPLRPEEFGPCWRPVTRVCGTPARGRTRGCSTRARSAADGPPALRHLRGAPIGDVVDQVAAGRIDDQHRVRLLGLEGAAALRGRDPPALAVVQALGKNSDSSSSPSASPSTSTSAGGGTERRSRIVPPGTSARRRDAGRPRRPPSSVIRATRRRARGRSSAFRGLELWPTRRGT